LHGAIFSIIVFFGVVAAQNAFGSELQDIIPGSEEVISMDEQFSVRFMRVNGGGFHFDINVVSSRNFMNTYDDHQLMPNSDAFNAPTYWYTVYETHDSLHPALNQVYLGGVTHETVFHSVGTESDEDYVRHWSEEHHCDATRWRQLPGEYLLMGRGTDMCR
jgi:hypothetical protein